MKIALVGRYGEGEIVGGPERVARELFSELQKNNLDVTFIEYFFGGYDDYSFCRKIVGKKLISQNLFRMGIIRIISLILKEKYDVIHLINIERFQIAILFLKSFLGAKIISTFHGITDIELKGRKQFFKKRYFLDKWVEILVVKKSDLIICPSSILLNEFQRKYRINISKLIVIPNGIDDKFIKNENRISFKQKFNLIFYNGFNSHLDRGLEKLIEKLSQIKKANINLFILGYSVHSLNPIVNLNIVYVGFLRQDSLIEFCRDKQFIIKSNTFDTFSILVLECMALGLIPIITENIGIKDYVKNGFNGFIYDCSKPDGLSELFEEIIGGRYDLEKISTNARDIYKELNWPNVTKHYVSAYKTLL